MELPHPFYSGFATALYLLLMYILVVGFLQHYRMEWLRHPVLRRSLIPVGVIALATGFWGLIRNTQETFDAIEAAGDISPSLVAAGISSGYPLLHLGLLCLILSLVFYYFNHKKERRS